MKPYYDFGGIQIFLGECCEVMSHESFPQLPIDHIITDPPYEQEAHTNGRRVRQSFAGELTHRQTGISDPRPVGFDAMDELTRCHSGQLMAGLASKWILIFCQVEAAMLWRDAMCPPARYFRTQVWRKPDGAPQFTGDRPGMGYESIVTCWGSKGRSSWNGGGRHGFYEYMTVKNDLGHQTQKPLALMSELITLFTDPGELILDPFMGSGTTLRAAKDLGRRAIGIEIEEKYAEIAARRLAQEVLF